MTMLFWATATALPVSPWKPAWKVSLMRSATRAATRANC